MNGLLIIFLIAMLVTVVGFKMYVYFFSVGYGFSIAGIGIAMLVLFRENLTPLTILMCALLIVYGLRLGGYLLIRELKSTAYKNLLKTESKEKVKVLVKTFIWMTCAILYVCECSPVFFRLQNNAGDDVFAIVGACLMALGIILEIAADMQKTKAKKKDAHMFVKTGLYKIVRCPNYFGELLLWTGAFVAGVSVLNSPLQWILAILGFVGINYVMFSGARRLELRQDKNYGDMPEYQEYVKKTPILIPFLPIYSVTKYKWLMA